MSTRTATIRVIKPGMFTTVQDLGRRGWQAVGVSRGGAADTLSLRAGNRLVGNDDGAAALEMTLIGGTFEFAGGASCVLVGGTAPARIDNGKGGRVIDGWIPFEVGPGERLVVGPICVGVRTYLCIAGGISVPVLLGSRATCLRGGFGGFKGRALREGDVVVVDEHTRNDVINHRGHGAALVREYCRAVLSRRTIRAVDGAHQETFDANAVLQFWDSEFEISSQSDRTGLRIKGIGIGRSVLDGRMPSEGMIHGAIQVPAGGEPIVLMVDHPTTGGYPVIACAAALDLAVLGQVAPRDRIRFERVSRLEARTLFAEQEREFNVVVPPT